MEIFSVLPTGSSVFPVPAYSLDDLRELQRNPAFVAIVQMLRGRAYEAGLSGSDPQLPGIVAAIEIIGFIEYEIQKEKGAENTREKRADEIGFDE